MSEEVKSVSDTPELESSGSTQEIVTTQTTDTVGYPTHKKLLGEKKKLDAKVDVLEQENKLMKQNQLEIEGKKDELIASLRSEITDTSGKLKSATEAFANKSVTSVIEREAAKLGCVNTADLVQLMPWDQISIDDNFNVDVVSVKTVLDSLVKEKSYMFQKEAPKTADGIPQGKVEEVKEKLSIKELAMKLAQ